VEFASTQKMVATVAHTIEMLALPIKPPHWSICSQFLDLELSKKEKRKRWLCKLLWLVMVPQT
jgi:hypothetical protein